MCMPGAFGGQKRVSELQGCERPCRCWKSESGPLQEQLVLLNAEQSLWSPQSFFFVCLTYWISLPRTSLLLLMFSVTSLSLAPHHTHVLVLFSLLFQFLTHLYQGNQSSRLLGTVHWSGLSYSQPFPSVVMFPYCTDLYCWLTEISCNCIISSFPSSLQTSLCHPIICGKGSVNSCWTCGHVIDYKTGIF